MKKCDILIEDCTLLAPDFTVREHQSIAVTGKHIERTDDARVMGDYEPLQRLSGKNKLVMPGMIDSHTHLTQQLLRGRITDEYPIIYRRFNLPYESRLTREDTALCARLAALEMIHAGITGFADAGCTYFPEMAGAVADSGLRAALTRSTSDLKDGLPEGMYDTTEDAVRISCELFDRYQGAGDGRIQVWFQFRSLATCSPKLISSLAEEAGKRNARIHTHLSEYSESILLTQNRFGMRECEYLDSLGVLSPDLLAAHAILLSESDLTLLQKRGVTVAACPRSNLGKGFPKTPRMLEMGIPVGLGTDGTAHGGLNLFREMTALKYACCAYYGAPYFDSAVMTSEMLLRMATQGGAAALGLSRTLGTLEAGRLADLILIDLSGPHLTPTHSLAVSLTEAAGPGDVSDMIVDGKLLMRDRTVLTLDEQSILRRGNERITEIARENGWMR